MSDSHAQLLMGGYSGPARTASSSSARASAAGGGGEVEHAARLGEQIGALLLNDDFSDVCLRVQGVGVRAHRVLLAARSDYFRALLFGGMRETAQEEIELVDTDLAAFKTLLRYIYTGRVSLHGLKEDQVLDILGLAHKYGFGELESAVSDYLKAVLSARNLCTVLEASHLYVLESLREFCLDFADKHASEILTTAGFGALSAAAVEQLIGRDSFCAPEIDIFRAVQHYLATNSADADPTALRSMMGRVRLPLLGLEDLLNVVRPSGLVESDAILDAIKERAEMRDMDLHYRGYLLPDANVATAAQGAQVLQGELKQALLNGDSHNYDMERGFTRHPIEDGNDGIVVRLSTQCIVNHIRLLLWDRDQRSYSYYIEVSMDEKDWVRVVDHSRYLCRSWQHLYFAAKVVRFIRVVGTHNSVNRVFHLVSLEAYYASAPLSVERTSGLVVARQNVARAEAAACVVEGVSRSRNALLNGDTQHYDWDSGYTCHQLGSGAIVVQLPQPYVVSSMRLLLWDCDDRSYSYYVEVSTDQENWKTLVDKTQEACSSWQLLEFDALPVTFVRIVGTQNSANEVFHCVHFECPAQPDAPPPQQQASPSSSAARSVRHSPGSSLAQFPVDLPQ